MSERPRIRSDNMSGALIIESPAGEHPPVVLLGRDEDELDVGLAFHAHAKAKRTGYTLAGMARIPFDHWERDEILEQVVELLLEFAIYARRYIDLVGDLELREKNVAGSSAITFGRALDRIVHAINFIPRYRPKDNGPGEASRDTLLVGVTVRTDKWTAETLMVEELCTVFLEHSPGKLFDLQREREDAEVAKRAEIAAKLNNRNG